MACHVVTFTITVIWEGMPEADLRYTFVLIYNEGEGYAKRGTYTRNETFDSLFVVVTTLEREDRVCTEWFIDLLFIYVFV
jgi:hypothetical protein